MTSTTTTTANTATTATITVKRASAPACGFDEDFEKCAALSADLVSSLAGAGIGGGLGLLSDAIRPADDDENRMRRRLVSLLAGATLGGIAGYGSSQFTKNAPVLFPEKPSPARRVGEALDPDVSTVVAAGGLGYGLHPHFSRGGRLNEMITPGARGMRSVVTPKVLEDRAVASALREYENVAGGGKRLRIGQLLDRYGLYNPFKDRVAAADVAEKNLFRKLRGSKAFKAELKGAGRKMPKASKGIGEAFAHNAARIARSTGGKGRALRSLALLAGGGAALYKGYDMTH